MKVIIFLFKKLKIHENQKSKGINTRVIQINNFLEIHMRIMKIMEILEINIRLTKIMKFLEI